MGYVLAAYALVGAVLGLYGMRLVRERRALLQALGEPAGRPKPPSPTNPG